MTTISSGLLISKNSHKTCIDAQKLFRNKTEIVPYFCKTFQFFIEIKVFIFLTGQSTSLVSAGFNVGFIESTTPIHLLKITEYLEKI